ncbi:MAG: UvrD-helicase domain-containing protein [Candidatus Micropelagos sp.]
MQKNFFSGEGASSRQRTLFAVGDEKQSIFSFQGADPDKFDSMRSYYAEKANNARADFKKGGTHRFLEIDTRGSGSCR